MHVNVIYKLSIPCKYMFLVFKLNRKIFSQNMSESSSKLNEFTFSDISSLMLCSLVISLRYAKTDFKKHTK